MTARFDAIGLIARDLPASLAFYRRLGLDVPADADQAPHVDIPLGNGLRLMIDPASTVAGFDPTFDPDADHGGSTLAFACASPADVDAVYADLVGAGYASHLAPFDAFWGQRYAVVVDPDGNHADLYAPLG